MPRGTLARMLPCKRPSPLPSSPRDAPFLPLDALGATDVDMVTADHLLDLGFRARAVIDEDALAELQGAHGGVAFEYFRDGDVRNHAGGREKEQRKHKGFSG